MEHSPRGDLQLLYPTVTTKLTVMFSAFRICPRSAIQAQEEVLDPFCEPYAQLAFTFVSFLHWIKESVGLDEQRLITKLFAGCFLLRGGQSVITLFCVDKLSELQISLVGELTSAITLILMRRAGNSHSAETS